MKRALCAVLVLGSCSVPRGSDKADELVVGPQSAGVREVAHSVATLDGGEVSATAAWNWLVTHDPSATRAATQGAILAELAWRESAHLGIKADAAVRADLRSAALRRLAEDAEVERGAGANLEQWCRERHGRSLDEIRSVLEADAVTEWVLQRAVQVRTLLMTSWDLSVILVKTQSKAEELVSKLRAGAEFAALARETSLSENSPQQGRLPPLADGMLSSTARAALQRLRPGEFSAALPTRDGAWQILWLHGQSPPQCADLSEARARVLAQPVPIAFDRAEWQRGIRMLEELYKLRRTANLAPTP